MKRSPRRLLMAAAPMAAFLLSPTASAQLLVSYAENPEALVSSLANTNRFTFNDLSTGYNQNVGWSGVGTFDKLYILGPNQYGGASGDGFSYGSNYSVQSINLTDSLVTSTTLTFDTPRAYFGFWWSAGDNSNVLSFYKTVEGVETLIAEYTTQTLLDALAGQPAYKGNPRNRGENTGESYAFINFLGLEGTNWDKLVLTNLGSSGFEADNYTDRETPWSFEQDGPLPGVPVAIVSGNSVVPVPEASASVLLGAAGVMMALRRRRSSL